MMITIKNTGVRAYWIVMFAFISSILVQFIFFMSVKNTSALVQHIKVPLVPLSVKNVKDSERR